MAWTAPRTWTDGELVTAAIMNPHVRDNLLAVGPHLLVRKTADQSVTSSTAFQADAALLVNIPANESWLLEWKLLIVAGTTGDFKAQWTFPTGGEISIRAVTENAAGTLVINRIQTGTSPAGQISSNGATGTVPHIVEVSMFYKNAGTAGNVTLEWAQNTSDATSTTMKVNSTLWGVKLA